MKRSPEVDTLRDQIRQSMLSRETDELLEIWRLQDHSEYTDDAFEVVHEILLDRLGQIPPGQELPMENQPDSKGENPYHDDSRLVAIAVWAKIISWFVLGVFLLSFIGRVVLEIQASADYEIIIDLFQLWTWLGFLTTPALGLTFFLVLQAVSEGIYFLMDIEENGLRLLEARKR